MICYSILIELGIKRVRKIELSPLSNCWGCPKVQSELEVGVEAQYNFFFKCADIFNASCDSVTQRHVYPEAPM